MPLGGVQLENRRPAERRGGVTRATLPDRRRNETRTILHREQPIEVTVGFDAAGSPREVFATGPREGSDMQHVLSDACVVISIALQSDIPPVSLAKSLGTVPAIRDGVEVDAPASPIGAILGVVMAASLPRVAA